MSVGYHLADKSTPSGTPRNIVQDKSIGTDTALARECRGSAQPRNRLPTHVAMVLLGRSAVAISLALSAPGVRTLSRPGSEFRTLIPCCARRYSPAKVSGGPVRCLTLPQHTGPLTGSRFPSRMSVGYVVGDEPISYPWRESHWAPYSLGDLRGCTVDRQSPGTRSSGADTPNKSTDKPYQWRFEASEYPLRYRWSPVDGSNRRDWFPRAAGDQVLYSVENRCGRLTFGRGLLLLESARLGAWSALAVSLSHWGFLPVVRAAAIGWQRFPCTGRDRGTPVA